MRTIGVVTVGRSDYGMYVPILRRIEQEPGLRTCVMVTGSHLSADHGLTVKDIEADGVPIGARVPVPLEADTPEAIAAAIGAGTAGFARVYAECRPDILLVLGDRFEMYAAAVAALPFTIPVAHIHGGELTQGAIDDALRHSLTKLSHLHFVAADQFARRVLQMGEEPWRVVVCGSPAVDQVRSVQLLDRSDLETRLRLRLEPPPIVVTFHPVTLEYEQATWQAEQLVAALRTMDRSMIMTAPNEDTGGRQVRKVLETLVSRRSNVRWVDALGSQAYLSLLAVADVMVGNSSSGLIEAPSFKLPVVNIGTRQQGRLKAENVIDTGNRWEEIADGIRRALQPEFRERLRTLTNPYGDGQAAGMIVKTVRDIPLDDRLMRKRFVDWPAGIRWREDAEVAAHVG